MIRKSILNILFSMIYLFLLIPLGLILKLFGIDFLDRKVDKTTKSYWS